MNTKNFPLFLIAVLSVFVLAGFAGATTDITASYPSTALHNSEVTVTFNLSYVGAKDPTTYNFSQSSTNIGEWKTLPALTDITNNSQLTLTAVLSVPEHASGTINAYLYADDMNSTSYHSELISITINNTASLGVESTTTLTKIHNGSITISNTGNVALGNVVLSSSGDFNISFSSNNLAISAGDSETVNVLALDDLNDIELGSYDLTILANDSSAGATGTLDYEATADFCENGNVNTTKIKITDIQDTSSDSGDEWEWLPLQEVEVEVDVENKLGDDEDFIVELALYDSEEHEFMQIDDEDTLTQDLSIDDKDTETATFAFKLPSNLEDSNGRYILYVKAYVDGDEDLYCNSYASEDVPDSDDNTQIKIDLNTNDVVLDDISAYPELVVTAGDTVTINARAYNIGKEDETKVKVSLTNSKLGLNLESSSFDLDMGDSQSVDFSFVVPSTAENGVYTLKMDTYFDYKKSSDTYLQESDESWDVKITVAGGVPATNLTKPQVSIAAFLDGSANAGSEMKVKATIKNTGTSTTTFVVDASGYESWATLKSISDRMPVLNAGESKDITLVFDVDKDAAGEQTFTLEVKDGTKLSSKEVAVTIGEAKSAFSGFSGLFANKTILWIVGAINLVLIILIVVLAVRMLRR